MTRAFCPKCGAFSFGYDQAIEIHRCYNIGCLFRDKNQEYGEGDTENRFVVRDADGLIVSNSLKENE